MTDSGMSITHTTGVQNAAPDEQDKTEAKRPAKDAKKAEWISYAQDLGINTEDKTKDELIDLVDQHESS